jgi:hypothetical protein
MISRPLAEVVATDLLALVTDQRPESRTIDYKLQLPGGGDSDKREFLADVTSFANAAGGDLVYGVEEDSDPAGKANGLPKAVPGLQGANANEAILRLEQVIRSGVDPRIPGVQLRAVDGFEHGQPVIIVRVPKSWAAPHMVTFGGFSRFFSRTSAGKHQLDVREIRAAFELSAGATERMQRFLADRMGRIIACETPVPLTEGPKVLLHLLPLSAFDASAPRQAPGFPPRSDVLVEPLYMEGSTRPNFDGLVNFYLGGKETRAESYAQFYRNGIIEVVDGGFCETFEGAPHIRMGLLEEHIIAKTGQYLRAEQTIEVEPPFFLVVGMIGVKGYRMFTTNVFARSRSGVIDCDAFTVPEVLIDNVDVDIPSTLRPIFDVMWQASGYRVCPHYTREGKRVAP